MHIERFDAGTDRDLVRACHAMHVAAMPLDQPGEPPMSARVFAGWPRMFWTEDRPETWLARDATGVPTGWYSLTLPERENTHLAYLSPLVGPPHRRHGMGTALVRHAAGRASEAGRAVLTAETTLGSPGEAFSRSLGARPGLAEATRVLDLRAIPDGQLARLRDRARAAAHGYSLLSWEGPTPEQYLEQVAALHQDGEDAPLDEGHERKHWDAARVHAAERRIADQGLRHYSVAARDDRTGELVALTDLEVDPQVPDWGEANKPRAMQFLEFLDRELKDRAFVAGAEYSVADITALVAVDFMRVSKLAAPQSFGNLQRWHKAVSARPSAAA